MKLVIHTSLTKTALAAWAKDADRGDNWYVEVDLARAIKRALKEQDKK